MSGSCDEIGDRGRHTAVPGDVFVHRAFDGHGDRVGDSGAAFINIPLEGSMDCAFGRVTDLDAVVRAFERAPEEGRSEFHVQFTPSYGRRGDWPDILAAHLANLQVNSLAAWADATGLSPGTVSRGFRLAYGISPKRFRLEQIAAQAARRIRSSAAGLSTIAAEIGFADQAHMTRAVSQLFAVAPRELRRLG